MIRKITEKDNLQEIAKILYQVDDYIYPDFCDGVYEDNIKFLSGLIGNCNFYLFENFWVIEDRSKIIGVLVTFDAPIKANKQEFLDVYKRIGLKVSKNFESIFKNYYKGYEKFKDCTVITSVAVDKPYRRMGYGKTLMKFVLDLLNKTNKHFILDVLKNNKPAIGLYNKMNFKVIEEREEYSEQICYVMEKL